LLTTSGEVAAHHAFSAEFDRDKPVTLNATVRKVEWINPHAWLHCDVKEADGKVIGWAIELAAPNGLVRRGFNRDSIPVGTKIIVKGYMAKDGSNKANGISINFEDGRRVFVGSSGTGAPEEK
jgi:hypothetical protein